LAACYAAAYAPLLQVIAQGPDPPPLPELIDELLSDRQFRRDGLNIWLALWGEIAVNPTLQAEHVKHYQRYEEAIANAIRSFAAKTGRVVDAHGLAAALIALLDGLWLQMCIAPAKMSRDKARAAIVALLEPHLGAFGVQHLT
jgi:AcrR family transcriptional regulator